MADTYCAPVYYAPTYQPVPEPFASIVVPCQLVEEWLYDRGPGNLLAVVRIRSGVVAVNSVWPLAHATLEDHRERVIEPTGRNTQSCR